MLQGRLRNRTAAAVAGLALSASGAHATWSIVLIDTRTGEVGVASATCLTALDLRAVTPVLVTGVGAATAQSFGDTTGQNRTFIRDRLLNTAPAAILSGLSTFDGTHQTRQYGFGDTLGRMLTFSGASNGQWAGGQTGSFLYVHAGQTGNMTYAIQGNVLSGSVVVQNAVNAAINTPGDMAARLMASMEAARAAGGDGRCSCGGSPTACGPTPPNFLKSSHIAYMLIAREGDRDAGHGIYRTGASSQVPATGHLNGDGRVDLVTANSTAFNPVSVLLNSYAPDSRFLEFAPAATLTAGNSPRSVVIADMNRDGINDLVVANFGTNNLSILRGVGNGTFLAATSFNAGTGPVEVVSGDFDSANGPDLAVANQTANTVSVRRNTGTGSLLATVTLAAGSDPRSLAVGDVTGDGRHDVVIASRNQSKLIVWSGDGAGGFVAAPDIATPAFPTVVRAADLDNDNDLDLVVATQGTPPGVTVLLNAAGTFTASDVLVDGLPTDVVLGDINGDQRPDALVPIGTRFHTLVNNGTGTLQRAGLFTVGVGIQRGALGDFDNDGDLDAAFTVTSTGSAAIVNNEDGDGHFANGTGLAFGDHFMTFNVPNAEEGDPDPVFTLRDMFDAWRTDLTGRPDAVQSMVQQPAWLGTNDTGELAFTLRDWRGQPLTAPITSVTVVHAPGSTPHTTIGPVTDHGGGAYSVMLTSGGTPGTDRFVVRVTDGIRPVVLMPNPEVTVLDCPSDYAGAGDAGTDLDIEAFFRCLGGVCCPGCGADLNNDGDTGTDLDIETFFFFLSLPC